ncbi:winged helix-turn-helix transcriptional regulator [Salibacterium qingdaonense]|uniref:Transcriptional regulator, HxlR family n=1 Tax=Salibacterium qingdaonense TaxID=266892 RepID=A0A1I4LEF6_9BACI|nr:helix-turn-helix domain-containing protein [Salibacterium qingdaonense]SFL89301.1 transcriptional regulator, HxlR family [Salibacterium qingdaonense]
MASMRVCPKFEEAFQLLGKRWIGVIIRVLEEGPMRFNEIAAQIPEISKKMLTERLKEMEEKDMVQRDVVPEKPVRILYSLTDKGADITPALAEVQKWADNWVEEDTKAEE